MSRTRKWFIYNGQTGGQLNPLNYFYTTINPPVCPPVGQAICAIYGVYKIGSGINPENFSTRLSQYVIDALASGTPQPPPPHQPYVLVKF